MESWIDHPNVTAVLHAGLPGQESGNAILDVLFGAVNPSARLPYTIARQRQDYPADVLYSSSMTAPQIIYEEELEIDYRHFDASSSAAGTKPPVSTAAPVNVTGTVTASGRLSSTSTLSGNATTTMSPPPVISSPAQTSPGGPASLFETALTVSYRVTNTGKMDGNEVSQVYLGFPSGAGEPPRVLRGFDRRAIRRGDTASVSIPLRTKDISIWDVVTQKWVVPSGSFTVEVGSSSRNIHLTGTFTP